MIKAVLFDLDGTLLNTLDDLADAVNHTLCENGYPPRSIDEVRSFVGNGIQRLVERSLPQGADEAAKEKCLLAFREYYHLHMSDKTREYDGITFLLHELKSRSVKVGILSNKTDDAVKSLCKKYFDGLYAVAVGESETIRRKPSPDGVWQVMRRLSCTAEETVYVGDSEIDILTARNAGVGCISVSWGFRDARFLLENGAETIADSPSELLRLLQ